MLNPKRHASRRHWELLSDELLLGADLTTDHPQLLDKLVTQIPAGEDEPHVEYKYDLRGQECEELRCVHCHQPHKAGYVMQKNGFRFFVGHICGAHIYGENFEKFTADYNAAVNRQQTLRRKREIEQALKPVLAWLQEIATSDVFDRYESVEDQIVDRMQWIADNLRFGAYLGKRVTKVSIPPTLFAPETDPRRDFAKLTADFTAGAMRVLGDPEQYGLLPVPQTPS